MNRKYPLASSKACYIAASVCFVLLAVLLLLSQDMFSGHYFQPKLLAVTHLAALGWGTLMIFGICCQSFPRIFKADFPNPKPFWISLMLFLSGLGLLVYSFWNFLPGLPMQLGSLLLFTAILVFAVQVFLADRRSREGNIRQEFISTAFIWLAVTALLGVLMVFNLRFAFLPKDHLDFLRIHAHAGIAGWFLMLVIGLNIGSYPSDTASFKLLSATYYSLNTALLLFLADAYFSGINLKTYSVLLAGLVGIAAYLLFLFKKTRKEKAVLFSVLSSVLLMLSAAVVPFIVHYSLKSAPSAVKLTIIYGTLVFMGWITAFVLSYASRNNIITCNKGGKVILASLFVLFIVSFFPGLLLTYKPLQYFGMTCLLGTACLFLWRVLSGLKIQKQESMEEREL